MTEKNTETAVEKKGEYELEDPKPMERVPVPVGKAGMGNMQDLDQMYRVATALSKAKVVPEHLHEDPGAVMMVMMLANQLGLNYAVCLSEFHYIKKKNERYGKLTMPAVMMAGMIQRSPLCKDYQYGWEGEGESRTAWVQSWREGRAQPNPRAEFSVAMAKKAGLVRDFSNWIKHPDDMTLARAMSRDAKRNWADVIYNTPSTEEMYDAGYEDPPPVKIAAQPAAPDPLLAGPKELDAEIVEPDLPDVPPSSQFCDHPQCELEKHPGITHTDADGNNFTEGQLRE